MSKERGFTLIETLVVMVLVGLLLVGVTALMVSTLKGGGKATIMADLRDEGDALMTKMERELRYGVFSTGDGCDSNGKKITFHNSANEQIIFEFTSGKITRKKVGESQKRKMVGTDVEVKETEKSPGVTYDIFECFISGSAGGDTRDYIKDEVVINVTLSVNAEGKVTNQAYRSSVTLRN